MQSNLGRVLLGIAVVAVAVVLLIVLKDDGDDAGGGGDTVTTTAQTGAKSKDDEAEKPTKPSVPTIVVENGKPVGGIAELSFDAGDRIRFEVTSNTDDEVHVHGYDVEREVGPGRPASFDFPATIEGLFEAELHESGEQIAELRIEP
jgi:hypothetical protein